MTLGTVLVALLAAFAVGLVVALWLVRQQREQAAQLASSLRDELAAQQQLAAQQVADRHQLDLQRTLDTLLQVAGEQFDARAKAGAADLDSRKALIDAELARMGTTLGEVTRLVQQLERDRAAQLGAVSEQLGDVSRVHSELARTAGALREALTSSQARGQWGERMATDVLRAAGFVEGVNYRTQCTTPSGGRPDVTFLLPGDLCLHMDVKFPLTNYLAMLEATGDADRDRYHKAFLKDVRARVKEITTRGYVDPEAGTLDCVLLFIPNEQVYGYVHEQDPNLLDEALASKVVLCSPSTLFAVLAVIRQSVEHVALERTSDEILQLLAGFAKQWEKFTEAMDKVGRGLDTTNRAFEALCGTRRNLLERQLDRVEALRSHRGVEAALADTTPRLVALHEDEDDAPPRRAATAG